MHFFFSGLVLNLVDAVFFFIIIIIILQQQQTLGTGLSRKSLLNQNSTRYIINASSSRPTDLLVKTIKLLSLTSFY
jgi:hypothetical protein